MAEGSRWFCDHAWLGRDGVADDVAIDVAAGRITRVATGAARPVDAVHLEGLTLPGFANAHSHAFHRGLRSRAQSGRGSFWTWRDEMYRLAATLTPEHYRDLARATFAEMVLAGYVAVGEFHYLHHDPKGHPYSEPNAMGEALLIAAGEAGIRLSLLDTCYLEAGPHRPVEGAQVRFCDGDAEAWAVRVERLAADAAPLRDRALVGAAIHSLRAVPPGDAAFVARFAARANMALHVHALEQLREIDEVTTAYGAGPLQLLEEAGALGPSTTVVHATHARPVGIAALGSSGTGVCLCPTTERDLADGIGPARRLADAGAPLCVGSDSQAVIDPFEELRAVELDERLVSGTRGNFDATYLLEAGTAAGHRALGWPDAGRLVEGARADLVTVSLASPRLAGALVADPGPTRSAALMAAAVFVTLASDVTDVVVDGRRIVEAGRHVLVAEPAADLRRALRALEG